MSSGMHDNLDGSKINLADSGDVIARAVSELKAIGDARRGERRVAEHEPAPTGQGRVVLTEYVIPKLDIMHELASLPQALGPLLKPPALAFLRQDLLERAEAGKAKYGTFLRANNGRDARMDLYQEICDAIMYAAQMRMEGSKSVGEGFVELLINLGSQLATEIHA